MSLKDSAPRSMPTWGYAVLIALVAAAVLMHGTFAWIDRPLFKVGVLSVTTFGIIMGICVPLLLYFLNTKLDAIFSLLGKTTWTVPVKAALVVFGVLGIYEVVARIAGADHSPTSVFTTWVAHLVRGD